MRDGQATCFVLGIADKVYTRACTHTPLEHARARARALRSCCALQLQLAAASALPLAVDVATRFARELNEALASC